MHYTTWVKLYEGGKRHQEKAPSSLMLQLLSKEILYSCFQACLDMHMAGSRLTLLSQQILVYQCTWPARNLPLNNHFVVFPFGRTEGNLQGIQIAGKKLLPLKSSPWGWFCWGALLPMNFSYNSLSWISCLDLQDAMHYSVEGVIQNACDTSYRILIHQLRRQARSITLAACKILEVLHNRSLEIALSTGMQTCKSESIPLHGMRCRQRNHLNSQKYQHKQIFIGAAEIDGWQHGVS